MTENLKTWLDAGEVVEVRGDGKAGSGLLMVMESFGVALGRRVGIQVHEWPLFSSARKGANVRAFMRIANKPINITSSIVRPHMAILLDETASEGVDFASGMKSGLYFVNTPKSAKETAERYRLPGTTVAVDGGRIGEKHLGHRMGNISILAAMVRTSGILSDEDGKIVLEQMMKKRRLPEKIRNANIECYAESLTALDMVTMEGDSTWSHEVQAFEKFPPIPMGAQSELRTSLSNKTARYRPAGLRLTFYDPEDRCSGCALCLTNCPENIITFEPDEKRALCVTGANVVDFCKLCLECVKICPVHLFSVEDKVAS